VIHVEPWYREAGLEEDYESLLGRLRRDPEDSEAAGAMRAFLKRHNQFYPSKEIWEALYHYMEGQVSSPGGTSDENLWDMWSYRMNAHITEEFPRVGIEAYAKSPPEFLPNYAIKKQTVDLEELLQQWVQSSSAYNLMGGLRFDGDSLLGEAKITESSMELGSLKGNLRQGFYLEAKIQVYVQLWPDVEGLVGEYEDSDEDDEAEYGIVQDLLEDVGHSIVEQAEDQGWGWEVSPDFKATDGGDMGGGEWWASGYFEVKISGSNLYEDGNVHLIQIPDRANSWERARVNLSLLAEALMKGGWEMATFAQTPHNFQLFWVRPVKSLREVNVMATQDQEIMVDLSRMPGWP